ncbi:ABC transporter ATP-binding protein [Bacillus cereus ATCC 14579]|uniref:ABC transporter ATP-binding protein n=1 Tax=Bacillus cereus (strain ATCC 14579 / DSM 31 / CCUG 7414 / JCM 2152 / NBRC 15305 / NCIMB 9373 / NCTC 2599 / NRRL B-3711) TaxID=226900 RepID=Q816K4_BACCR|nr:ABC transporter ATP-binding protein [Bacillus cereus ATCC 14579]
MKTMLEAKGISKIYDTGGNTFEALKDIQLQVKEGEFVGIMGPSGSGKTTLLNVLSTIDTASKGEILIDGKDIVKMNDDELALFRRNHLGFIFQDYNLIRYVNSARKYCIATCFIKGEGERSRISR